jgi:hypothetical protein
MDIVLRRQFRSLGFTWVDSTLHGDTPGFYDPSYFTNPNVACFANYVQAIAVYKCPAERTVFKHGEKTDEKLRSYSMNSLVASLELGRASPFQRTGDLRVPSETFLFIDVEPASICHTPFLVPLTLNSAWFHAPGGMHAKATVLSYTDGHTESHKFYLPGTRGVMASSPHPPPTDKRDVEWLRKKGNPEAN